MGDAKAAVAAMMKLPKAERLKKLMALSEDAIGRKEDAGPYLSLIQLELEAPDSEPPLSRPASSASSVLSSQPPLVEKSMRRQLKEKRDELRAMLADVDRALGSNHGKPAAASLQRPDAVAFAHMPRSEQLRLAKQSGFTAPQRTGGPSRGIRLEVPEHIKLRFKEEHDADPEGFRKLWEEQTPEFRRQCSAPSKPPTPDISRPEGNPASAPEDMKRWIQKLEGGGRARVSDARGAQSSLGGYF